MMGSGCSLSTPAIFIGMSIAGSTGPHIRKASARKKATIKIQK
jgi:hypothetical protein